MSNSNKLEVPGVATLPWEWVNVGAAMGSRKQNSQCVAARCNFTVRRGFDAAESIDYGSVVEGLGDMGINLRSKQYAFTLSASNLSYKTGNDAPLRAQSILGNTLASLKMTVAHEYSEDSYMAVSWDIKQKKPELALAWSGQTFTENATLLLRADPVDRALRLGAAVSIPGPEWRNDVLDEDTGNVESPADTGGRHAAWVEHELRPGALLGATRAGLRLDVGRLANLAADWVDYNLEPSIPGLFWRIPLMPRLYNLLVPAEDLQQERHNIRGWHVEVAHDWATGAPTVGVTKRIKSGTGSVQLGAHYDLGEHSAQLSVRAKGAVLGCAVTRGGEGGWVAPAFTLSIQPLAFL